MARPRRVQKTTNSQYFQDVTPLWVGPGRKPIEFCYKNAVDALVDWVGSDWINNDKSNFFLMRQVLIKSCDSWLAHDWQSDALWIEERRTDAKYLSGLDRAFSKFSWALQKAPFRSKKKMLGLAFLAELQAKPTSVLTSEEGIAAVERAIERFGENLKGKDRGYARYGAIEYAGIPSQLPRQEVAIALSLADQITFWRRDGLSEGTLVCPHKPCLSKNLPWKAIALFASAKRNSDLDDSTIQTLVTSLARKIVLVHWRGDAPENPESESA